MPRIRRRNAERSKRVGGPLSVPASQARALAASLAAPASLPNSASTGAGRRACGKSQATRPAGNLRCIHMQGANSRPTLRGHRKAPRPKPCFFTSCENSFLRPLPVHALQNECSLTHRVLNRCNLRGPGMSESGSRGKCERILLLVLISSECHHQGFVSITPIRHTESVLGTSSQCRLDLTYDLMGLLSGQFLIGVSPETSLEHRCTVDPNCPMKTVPLRANSILDRLFTKTTKLNEIASVSSRFRRVCALV